MPRYQFTKGGQTFHFDWYEDRKPTKEELNKIAEKLTREKELESPIKHIAKLGVRGALDTIEEIKEGPIGKAWQYAFSPPDVLEDLRKQGQRKIAESEGPTPSIRSGNERLDTFAKEAQRNIASEGLNYLTPTRFDIATLGLGLAGKPVLKAASKALPEIEEGVKFLSGIGHELGSEAGVLKIGSREKGVNPRTLGTNPRAIKEAEKSLDTIIELVAAGTDKGDIAKQLNIKPGTLDTIFKKHKIASKDQDIVDAVNAINEGSSTAPPKQMASPPENSGGGNFQNPPKGPEGSGGGNTPSHKPGREPFQLRDLTDLLGPFQRSMQSLGEMSFPLRQGRVALLSHPTQAPAVFKNMFKAAKNPNFADELIQEINQRPFANIEEFADTGEDLVPVTRNLYREAKLGLSDPTDVFPSNLAHQIPGIAQLSKRSEAAYGAGADTLRANLFDQVLAKHGFDSLNLPDPDTVKQLGNYVNTVTGYGRGGQTFEQATPLLQYGLYSPRYQKSIFDMLNPVNYTGMTERFGSIGAKEMAKDVGKFGAATVGGLEAADQLTGDAFDFSLNPLDTDFLKVKIGNTRLDPLGGFAPMMRLGARTGHDLLQRGFGDPYKEAAEPVLGDLADKNYDLAGEVERFARSKAAPGLATLALDATVGEGKNIVGEPLENQQFFGKSFETPYLGYGLRQNFPLYYQDMAEIEEPETAAIAAVPGFFGLGAQTYERKPRKKKDPINVNPYAEVDALYKKLYGR